MIIGQYQSKVAENGRVALPKKFRDQLGNNYIITQGYEGSLMIVPFKNWEILSQEIINKPFLVESARATSRFLLGNATEIKVDEQGRFVIPPYLRKYGKIDNEAVILGLGKYIELWDSRLWEEYHSQLTKTSEEVAQKLSEVESK